MGGHTVGQRVELWTSTGVCLELLVLPASPSFLFEPVILGGATPQILTYVLLCAGLLLLAQPLGS